MAISRLLLLPFFDYLKQNCFRVFLTALLGILFLPLNIYSNSKFGYIPIPNSLVGYQKWSGPSPTLRIEINSKTLIRLRSGSDVILKINAPEAQEMKLSETLDFREVPWRKVKKKQSWILRIKDNQTVYTLYAVFRYYHSETKQYLISPIIHDSIHLQKPYKKITRTASGYFDWYDLTLNVETLMTDTKMNKNPSFVDLQKNAEEKLRQITYKTIQKLPIHYDYSLGDFLFVNAWILPDFREAIHQMRLIKVYYPTPQSIFIEEEYSLLGNGPNPPIFSRPNQNKSSIYHHIIQKLYKKSIPPPTSPYTDREISTLIIDTRGTSLEPVLLVEVEDNKGNTILTPISYFQNLSGSLPYFRYLRDIGNISNWPIPDNALVIKALDVDRKNNRIVILEQYGKIIRNHKKQIQKLVNGNFYVITD